MPADRGAPVKTALEYWRRVGGMCADPDLRGDQLLFALTLEKYLRARLEQGQRCHRHWMDKVAEMAGQDRDWVRRVITDDVPRHEPTHPAGYARWSTPCAGQMIRRDGPCGQRSTQTWVDRDPDTGAQTWVGACSRHRPEVEAQWKAHVAAWHDNGKPQPPANTGGVLMRYFDGDWEAIYRQCAPWRVPEHGLQAPPPATVPKPALRLIAGDGIRTASDPADDAEPGAATRPQLVEVTTDA